MKRNPSESGTNSPLIVRFVELRNVDVSQSGEIMTHPTCASHDNLRNSVARTERAGLLPAARLGSPDQGRGLACASLGLKAERRRVSYGQENRSATLGPELLPLFQSAEYGGATIVKTEPPRTCGATSHSGVLQGVSSEIRTRWRSAVNSNSQATSKPSQFRCGPQSLTRPSPASPEAIIASSEFPGHGKLPATAWRSQRARRDAKFRGRTQPPCGRWRTGRCAQR